MGVQILLSLVGVFLLFAINTCTYIGVIFAMVSWRRPSAAGSAAALEAFLAATKADIAPIHRLPGRR